MALTKSKLLVKLSRTLLADPEQQNNFMQALLQPQPFNPCVLWCRERPELLPFATEVPLSWQPDFVDRLPLSLKPGQHPWHVQGQYYCLDFSSVFAASTLLTLPQHPTLVVDLCAAPGGKSLFAWQALHPQLLLCNEVIGKRIGMLVGNLQRCQVDPVIVLSADVSKLGRSLSQAANLVVVDAPCTGQSLLAKGGTAPGCFHPVTINRNANRQKRIIAHSAQLVAPQGHLAYMTCAFSREENEQVITWFLRRFPHFQVQKVPHLETYQSHLSDLPCYRMWPQSRLGAGAFTVLLHNTESGPSLPLDSNFLQSASCKWCSRQTISITDLETKPTGALS